MIEPHRQFDVIVLGATSLSRRIAQTAEQAGLRSKLLQRNCRASAALPNAATDAATDADREVVWSVIPQPGAGFRVDVICQDGPLSFFTKRLVAEAMPIEVVVPFPGWTLDGVMALGEALRSMGAGQPQHPILAGMGGAFWSGIACSMAHGVIPAAVICPDTGEACGGVSEQAVRSELSVRNIPIYDGWQLVEAVGTEQVEGALIVARGTTSSRSHRIEADGILVHDGVTWRDEIPRLLGAEIHCRASLVGDAATTDHAGRTSIPGLYSVPQEESDASSRGVQIALDAAENADWPAIGENPVGESAQPAWADRLVNLPLDLQVCRYEPLTISDLKQAIDAGARDLNQLKQFTRMGMGVCQGRPCEEITAQLMAQHLGVHRSKVGRWTMRPPLEMVDLSTLAGTFQYSDIPIPRPAPL